MLTAFLLAHLSNYKTVLNDIVDFRYNQRFCPKLTTNDNRANYKRINRF